MPPSKHHGSKSKTGNKATSGIVTRSSSKQEEAQRPSKRMKTGSGSEILYKLGWIFLHQDVGGARHLDITESMLNQLLGELDSDFKMMISGMYGVPIDERMIQVHIVKDDTDINLKEISLTWMADKLRELGTPCSIEFVRALSKVASVKSPSLTIRQVIDNLKSPDDTSRLHLIVTAPVLQETGDVELNEVEATIRRFTKTVIHGKESKITCPSQAAKSEFYITEQNDPDLAIYDGRRGGRKENRVVPPIEIFHPIFETFYSHLHDPGQQPSKKLIRMTYEFMEAALTISTSEDGKVKQLRPQLSKILERGFMTVGDTTRADGSVWLMLKDLNILLVVMELKREYGEGGCDPATQASFAFRNYWLEHQGLRDKCCCPTFIIAVGGPWLGLLGGVFTDKFIVQRLTELTWTGLSSVYEDKRLYWLARTFHSLGRCLEELQKYYQRLTEISFNDSDYYNFPPRLANQLGFPKIVKERFFPYPHNFIEEDEHGRKQIQKFSYIHPLESSAACVTYLAKICHDNDDDDTLAEEIVVKFVAQYGEDVHRFLAKEGHAPKLRYLGPLLREDGTCLQGSWLSSVPVQDGQWAFPGLHLNRLQMVVMDYVKACDEVLDPPEFRKQIEEVLDKLHGNGFVFGDLRPPNVIFAKDKKVKFIDFDWSGRYKGSGDEAILEDERPHYPLGLSDTVVWPDNVNIGLEVIKPEHDWFMLQVHFG